MSEIETVQYIVEPMLLMKSSTSYRYVVESTFLDRLGDTLYDANASVGSLWAGVAAGGSQDELLMVNTNVSDAFVLTLGPDLAFSGTVEVWTWISGTAQPGQVVNETEVPTLVLAPTSIAIIVAIAQVGGANLRSD